MNMTKFDSEAYSINDFKEWKERKELVLAAKFQRRGVWSNKARSYLIDTILRGLPIPKLFIRHEIDPATRKSIREVVDGQQRIRAILNYLDDGFKVSKIHNEEFGGKTFSQLPLDVQKNFLHYRLSVDLLIGAEDSQVLDIFARLNTYTVRLNKQELLNAKYFGLFKRTVYELGYEFANFLMSNKVLTEKEIARMLEAELTSELLILVIDGIKDRKQTEPYYKKYDDEFDGREAYKNKFKSIMDKIALIFGDDLKESNFSARPLFYSLFGVLSEIKIKKKDYPKIANTLQEIDYILNKKPDEIGKKYFNFYDASTTHVTDLSRRKIRHEFIKKMILQKLRG